MSEETKVAEDKPPSQPKHKSGTSSVWKFPLLSIIVVTIAVVFFQNSDDPKLLGTDIPLRKSLQELSPLEQKRWSSEPISFPGASPLQPTKFPLMDFDFAEKAMTNEKPLLLKGIPRWAAMSKWTPEYFQQHFPIMSVHVPSNPVVRLHQDDETHPFGSIEGLNWTRPWLEQQVYTSVMYKADKLMYSMVNAKYIPNELLKDLDISRLAVAYSPPLEVNMWMGTPMVTTPAHYDFVHNFYTQIYGKKRWIMFPPEDAFNLYLYTALHPSARQSQIDFNAENSIELFPDFKNVHPIEVVLEPGDVLYIPPMWFHYVAAVGNTPSISISTHTDSQQAKIRERIMTKSEAYFKSLFQKQKYNKKNLALTVNIAAKYLTELFADSNEAKEFLRKLVASHWSHFEHDRDVIGLKEKIAEARAQFPSKEEIEKAALPSGIQTNIASASRDIKQLLHQFNGGVREILTMNHIEETAAYLVGPLNVDPLLRYLAEL